MICQYSDSCTAWELSDGKLCNSAAIKGKVTAQQRLQDYCYIPEIK